MTTPVETPVETVPAEETPTEPTEQTYKTKTDNEKDAREYKRKTRYHVVVGGYLAEAFDNEDDAYAEALTGNPGYGVLAVEYVELIDKE